MKYKFSLLFILLLIGGIFAYGQSTIVPAGLGQMSFTQPSRTTATLTAQLLSTGGQNPTVKILWGDEDGEQVGMSWDNEVTVSTNQAVGSFSTTIDIPNLEKVYYFRAWASNAGGTVCLLYTSPSPRDATLSRMPSSA